jgi:cystathionine gamma-synthase
MTRPAVHPDTLLAHAGCAVDPTTGALVAAPVLSTTFERDASGGYRGGHVYSRTSNPTRALLESTLAELEGAERGWAFASGMAAAHAVLATLPAGSHVVLADDVYFGVRHLLETVLAEHLTFTSADLSRPDTLAEVWTPQTRLVWAETPSNPLLRITDLRSLAGQTHARGAVLAVDGTWATPVLQRPLACGADLVVHSITKYIAGHSDVLGGAVLAREESEHADRIAALQAGAGAVLDPFACWLTLRGMRTLAVRVRAQSASAQILAERLHEHPNVARVHYPGLADHPGHETAARQMVTFGAMLSVEVRGAAADARRVANTLTTFRQATSLGGTESLVEHRASVEGAGTRAPETLLRLSIGLEHVEDLWNDLSGALAP